MNPFQNPEASEYRLNMIYKQGFSVTFLETPVELFLALEFLAGPPVLKGCVWEIPAP